VCGIAAHRAARGGCSKSGKPAGCGGPEWQSSGTAELEPLESEQIPLWPASDTRVYQASADEIRVAAELARSADGAQAIKGKRDVYFEEERKFVATPVYDFVKMHPGMAFAGPAIVETPVTTMVVNPNDRAAMDEYRNIRIHLGA